MKMVWNMAPQEAPGSSGDLSASGPPGLSRDLSASVIGDIFGLPGSARREEFITNAKVHLQVKTFRESQLDMLKTWRTIARVDCPPGCGKTTMLMALCVGFFAKPT